MPDRGETCCPDMGEPMAHRGVAPKSVKLGRTPNAEWTEVLDVPYTGPSPDLPKLPNRRKWNDLVAMWWEQVRSMPHCVLWRPTDWTFALETAVAKNEYYALDAGERTTTAFTEIRRREAQLGTTAEARRQLRIRYVRPADEADEADDSDPPVEVVEQEHAGTGGATVTPLADRRARLTRPA